MIERILGLPPAREHLKKIIWAVLSGLNDLDGTAHLKIVIEKASQFIISQKSVNDKCLYFNEQFMYFEC
jgi:hypothetical protein